MSKVSKERHYWLCPACGAKNRIIHYPLCVGDFIKCKKCSLQMEIKVETPKEEQ